MRGSRFRSSAFVLVWMLSAGVAAASSQELSEAAREERCRTNAQRSAEYRREYDHLGLIDNQARVDGVRKDAAALDDHIKRGTTHPYSQDLKTRQRWSNHTGLGWKDRWTTDHLAFQIALRDHMSGMVRKAGQMGFAGITARREHLRNEIRFHAERMAELKCGERADSGERHRVKLSGEWNDNWGYKIQLTHDGDTITGTFTKGGNVGQFTGGSLDLATCTVILNFTEPWKKSEGKLTMKLDEATRVMEGAYVSNIPGYSSPQTGSWRMTRVNSTAGSCKPTK